MIQRQLKELLQQILKELGIESDFVELSHPQVASQGDLSTNAAMVAAKKAGKNPRELAEQIVKLLRTKNQELKAVAKIEFAGPGFINFYLTPQYFVEELNKLLTEGNATEQSGSLSGKKVMVEFTDPNPFKEFHIGHLYSNIVGESISRLIESQGAEVKRANYQGDIGLHVAKAVWGMQEKLQRAKGVELREKIDEIQNESIQERAKWLGESYALGASAYEEGSDAKQEIVDVNKKIYEASSVILRDNEGSQIKDSSEEPQNDISLLYSIGRQWSLDYFETIYVRLGTKFVYYYFESKAGAIGHELVNEFLTKGIFRESEGAIIFPGEEHGLHTRVFINSLGLPTYEAKELGLARTKYADYPFDISISITGNEINEYFKVLLKVLSLVSPEIAAKTKHLSHGMVRLPEGKMSSRTGNVITGAWLLDEAARLLKVAYPDMNDETVEKVAVGAIKWALLRSGIGKDISFSFEDSISFEGDSGPYIQYSYARTQSVLSRAKGEPARNAARSDAGGELSAKENNSTLSALSPKPEAEEEQLLKLLVRFDEVVIEAAEKYSPNMLTNYLFDLAQAFNLFYQKQRILDPMPVILSVNEGSQQEDSSPSAQNDNTRTFRLRLTEATGKTLERGLYLLGIQAPEKM